MTEWVQALLLALIQGISEFLPVSSSAHLVLPSLLLGWPDQGLAFDVAVHAGTLLAVLIYFRNDLLQLARGVLTGDVANGRDPHEVWKLGLATLPAVVAGMTLSDWVESSLRGLGVIASSTLVFGLLLIVAAKRAQRPDSEGPSISWMGALFIGLAQALALIPGTSRSGVTITVAVLLGYSAETAARFSFLLSIPVISGALLFIVIEAGSLGQEGIAIAPTLLAAGVAFLSAWATIALFLKLISRIGLMPFAVYRIVLAGCLFLVLGQSD